jgi:hypothetical protein
MSVSDASPFLTWFSVFLGIVANYLALICNANVEEVLALLRDLHRRR